MSHKRRTTILTCCGAAAGDCCGGPPGVVGDGDCLDGCGTVEVGMLGDGELGSGPPEI